MENIDIPSTARTPRLSLDVASRVFLLEGESYPEDTKKFYEEPVSHVINFLSQSHDGEVVARFKFKYFNSSSAKVLMDLCTALESSAKAGNQVLVEWHYVSDDENMKELGEEFSEELSAARFTLIEY
ncbi:MAG: DUF1987 domain-containing protein [Betaproteobacteria bacterium]|nr:DUF1987 domain-containing protein [Betaproteobacteria bacterium]NCA16053.1 DUF1987 domain-containing protein [Betaproteobacteria bacterium]NDF03738.1 DUF1987 domain-containing protein [Betaproteobacteria bacterium]